MSKTILCVDVDRQLLQILERVLGDEGYRPLIAHDGEQALLLLESERPALVLLDIALPRRDGFDVLQTIRARSDAAAGTPVVLTSGGRITPEYEARARELNAQAMLAKPVPLTELLSCVREYAKQIAQVVDSRNVRGGDELEGSLCELGFPHLLHRLHGLRASGVLMLSSGRKKKAIEMQDGYPVAVKSNLVTECLGNHLVRAGRLSEGAVTESLARMKKGEGLQGQILVAMDVITDEEIGEALRQQAEDKLFQIFEWKRGSFKLERTRTLKRANTLALGASPANIILEGVRRRAPIDVIDGFLKRNASRTVRASESPFYRFQEVDLSATDRTLVEGLDPECTLGDLIEDDESMRRTLYALLATELLELGPEASSAEDAQIAATPDGDADDASQLRSELVAMARRLRGQNYFEILGVTDADSSETVKQAWQRLAKQTHPDRHKRASPTVRHLADDVFAQLSEAYETLSNPTRREAYRAKLVSGGRTAAARDREGSPACAEVEFQLGETLLRQRDYEQALAHFRRARESAPRDGLYLAHYGWTLHLCNADDATVAQEALAHLKRAVRLARDQEKPYLFLGRLCKAVGDGQGAEGMFTRAVQIRPDCVEAIRELRLINMRRGKGRSLIGKLLRR